MAKLIPTGDRVLVRLDKADDTFDGGIIARPDIAKSKPKWGVVVAAGPGRVTKKGALVPMELFVGDRVCIEWRTGSDIMIGGKEHVMVRESEVIAVDG